MTDVSIHQFLALFTWFPLAALFLFMLLIARTFSKFSGHRTFYWAYLIPTVCYGAVLVRTASVDPTDTDWLVSGASVLAGTSLLFLSLLLYRLMMAKANE